MQLYKRTCATLPELFIANLSAYAASVKRTPPSPSPTNAGKFIKRDFTTHGLPMILQEHLPRYFSIRFAFIALYRP